MAKSKLKLDLSTNNVISCVFYALIGILLIIFKSGSLDILMTIIGALMIIQGVLDVIKNKEVVKGVISIIFGVAIIVLGWVMVNIVLMVLGVMLIIKGILEASKTYKNGFMSLLPALITIVLGICLFITKWAWGIVDIICIVVGVVFIINAILSLFGKKVSVKKSKK